MKALLIAAVVLCAIAAVVFIVDRLFYPIRRAELHLLNAALDYGGGFDDAAQVWLNEHRARYAPEVLRMLQTSTPGSDVESEALRLVELVLDTPGTKEAVRRFGCAHASADTVRLVADILEGPPATVPIAQGGNLVISEVIDRPRSSPNAAEEKGRLGCGDP